LYELFESYCPSVPRITNPLPDKRTNKVYSSIRFETCALPCFNELFNLFYLDGKKVIPKNIGDLLSPLGLAYWICDDGYWTGNSVHLCTNSFTMDEINLLISVLTEKFNLKCTVCVGGGSVGYIIRISAKSIPHLRTLLTPIMPPMMMYKIGLVFHFRCIKDDRKGIRLIFCPFKSPSFLSAPAAGRYKTSFKSSRGRSHGSEGGNLEDFLATVINQYLSEFSLSITQEELDILISINKVEFELPLDKTSDFLLEVIGRSLKKSHPDSTSNQFVGVYMLTNKITGELYVGSSIDLGTRIRHYFKPSVLYNNKRAIIQSLREYGVENFSLAVYKIDPILFDGEFKPLDFSRALEQYYIFTKNPVLNTIKVAGGYSTGELAESTKLQIDIANSKPLYVYNKNKTILHFVSDSSLAFLKEVQMSYSTLATYLANGKAMHGKFIFSRELLPGVEVQLMGSSDLSELITEGKIEQILVHITSPETREKILNSNTQKKSITLIHVESGEEYYFVSLSSASRFTRSFALNNASYIGINKLSDMKSGDSYKGFLVRK
jgi:hypothetical protein